MLITKISYAILQDYMSFLKSLKFKFQGKKSSSQSSLLHNASSLTVLYILNRFIGPFLSSISLSGYKRSNLLLPVHLFSTYKCDVADKLLWKFNLDLEAIYASNSDVPSVIDFLQRRKLEANKAKQLCLGIKQTLILEHRPVHVVVKAMSVLVTPYCHPTKTCILLKGMEPEMTLNSGAQNVDTDLSAIESDTIGKSIVHEYTTRFDGGTLDSEDESQFANI